MIRYKSEKHSTLEGFDAFFHTKSDRSNSWVKLSGRIAWDELARGYYRKMVKGTGRPAKDVRLVIRAVIIKHKLCLSDEETIEQIRENPYLQYFVGLTEYRREAASAPSLFVEIRRRMGEGMFSDFYQKIVDEFRFAGKPLGRPPKMTDENKAEVKKLKQQKLEEYRQRIPIEGKFGQGRNGYGLDYIRAKTARTSEAWIKSIFLVMNLMVLGKVFLLLRKILVIWGQIIAKLAQAPQKDLNYAIELRCLSRSTVYGNI